MSGSTSEQAVTSAGLSHLVIPQLLFCRERGGAFPSGPRCMSMGQYGHQRGGTGRTVPYSYMPCQPHPNASHFFSSGRTAGSLGSSRSPSGEPSVAGEQRGCYSTQHQQQWGEGAAPHLGSSLNRPGAHPWEVGDVVRLQNCLILGTVAAVNCPTISQGLMCSFPTKAMVKKVRAVLSKQDLSESEE